MKKIFSFIAALALTMPLSAAGWAPAGDNIRTKWADEVDPQNTLPEYPRPQMVRNNWMNLNGLWDYAITALEEDNFAAQGQILVPFAVESSLSGVGKLVGKENALWYERSFKLPSNWKGKKVLLHFGAVDWKAEVWVNGKQAGIHTGGYTPFSFDITSLLKKSGSQTVRLKVFDASDQSYQPRGKQVCNPNGIWYTPVTGIWQTVWAEAVPQTSIESYYPVSNIDESTLTVNVKTAGLQDGDVVKVSLLEGGVGYNPEKPSEKLIEEAVAEDGKVVFNVKDAKLWSPDSPYLYGLKISIVRGKKIVDSVQGYTQMRKISRMSDDSPNRYNRLALNNEILFQFGPLDQGWWPDGLYTAPTDEALRFDIEKTREWGFNMIRKHIKVEPARWYYYCDMLGMLVWQDMPCIDDNSRNRWSGDSFLGGTDCVIPEEWQANYYKEWGEIIDAVKGFQCIVVWIPFNEAWGQFNTPAAVKFTREQDPTRLVNESSGGNFSFSGDIIDVHHYPCPAMNAFERKFINVLGEYGGIGYPTPGHLWKKDSNWGYGGVKASTQEVQKQYNEFLEMLKTFQKTGCAAAVYTQTTDVEVEVNGLMTYDRIPKLDEAALRAANKAVIHPELKPLCPCRFESKFNGKQTHLYTLVGNKVILQVTDYGARVVSIFAPGRDGKYADVATGYGSIYNYTANDGERFLGASIGPVGNRTADASFVIDGVEYKIPVNNNDNNLHGGMIGADSQVWDVVEYTSNKVVFTLTYPDGFEGFPGKRTVKMTYTMTENDEFRIDYEAVTDKKTPLNLTNHAFFNLTGDSEKSILGHVVMINSSKITPVDEELIPSGEFMDVTGTPFDFRQEKAIGKDINADHQQIAYGPGYDHNWCIDRKTTSDVELMATVYEPESGRVMEVWSDQPGLQFYAGNFFDGSMVDKYGNHVGYRCSFAMETQKYPDAMHHDNFPGIVLNPGETYTHTCIYKFSTR